MTSKFRSPLLIASQVAIFSPASTLLAVDYTWTGTTSNAYATTTNWSPNGNPGVADNVLINTNSPNPTTLAGNWERRGAGTTTLSGTGVVNCDVNTGTARFLNNGSFTFSGGQFNHNGEYFIVGNPLNGTTGTFTHSGGTLTSTHSRGFFISDGAAALGSTYTLSGGTMNVSSAATYQPTVAGERRLRSVWLGKGGEGTVTAGVTGDTFKITSGTATFTRTHATATADLLISRNSILQVEGGTITFDKYNEVRVGYGYAGTDSSGTTPSGANGSKINVTNGTLNITGGSNVRVGYADAGTLQMSGGNLNLTGGNLSVGTGGATGTLTMSAGTLTATNTVNGVDIIGGGLNGNATVTLSGTSIVDAANTKWKTGDFGGVANNGTTSISLSDSAALTLKEFTIGHIGGATATETVSMSGTSNLTVNNFITIGRDDNSTQSGIVSTLNLNGGTLSTKYIVKGSDVSDATKNLVNANGGTIKALAAEPDFFKIGTLNAGRVYVNLQAGGLTFNTNSFNVGIQTPLNGSGGLTKTGAGTLTLTGSQAYTGTTLVSTGTLKTTTGESLAGPCTIGTGATLTVDGSSSNSWTLPGLTMSNGSTLSLPNLQPNASTPWIDATSSLSATGTVTVVIPKDFVTGDYPLIKHSAGAIGGDGISAFHLAPQLRGVEAEIIDVDNTVTLRINAVDSLVWNGNVNSTWDINSTANWTLGGDSDKYIENDVVVFDDSSTSTNVTLDVTVAPNSVTFGNVNDDYTLSGTGAIAGSGPVNKYGSATVTLATAITTTGTTQVLEGTLKLGDGTLNGSISGLLVNNAGVAFNPTGTATHAGSIGGSIDGIFTKMGAGTQVITSTVNTSAGKFVVNEGTLQFGNGTLNGEMGTTAKYEVASNASLRLDRITAFTPPWARITGAGNVRLNSAQAINATADWGALTMPAEYTGTLRVERGRVGANTGKAALGGTGKIEILNGAQFLAFTSANAYTTPIEIEGAGWGEGGYPGGLRLAGGATATWAGSVTLTADSAIMAQRTSNFTVTGAITGTHQCEFYAGDPVGDSGNLFITPTVPGQNTYASTKINGRPNGSVIAGSDQAFSSGPLVVDGAILKLDGHNPGFASLSGTGGAIGNYHASNAATLTVGSGNTDTSYAGVLRNGGAAPLALTKTGTGKLTLTAPLAYTGTTTVDHGSLALSTTSLSDTAAVAINNDGVLELNTAGASDVVGSLLINGNPVGPGIYDSNHGTYGSFFAGNGKLVVGGFEAWAATKGLDGTPGKENGATDDPDKDGMQNLIEFYLDGDPLANDPSILPAATVEENYLTLTFHRRNDAEASVASQRIQYGTDLANWVNATITSGNSTDGNGVIVTVAETNATYDTITVKIPRTLGPNKLFGRLQVTK